MRKALALHGLRRAPACKKLRGLGQTTGIPPLDPYPNGAVTQITGGKKAGVNSVLFEVRVRLGNHASDRLSTRSLCGAPLHTPLSCQQPQFSLVQDLPRDLSRPAQSSTQKLFPTSFPSSIKSSALVAHLRIEATPVFMFNSNLLSICMDLFIW